MIFNYSVYADTTDSSQQHTSTNARSALSASTYSAGAATLKKHQSPPPLFGPTHTFSVTKGVLGADPHKNLKIKELNDHDHETKAPVLDVQYEKAARVINDIAKPIQAHESGKNAESVIKELRQVSKDIKTNGVKATCTEMAGKAATCLEDVFRRASKRAQVNGGSKAAAVVGAFAVGKKVYKLVTDSHYNPENYKLTHVPKTLPESRQKADEIRNKASSAVKAVTVPVTAPGSHSLGKAEDNIQHLGYLTLHKDQKKSPRKVLGLRGNKSC